MADEVYTKNGMNDEFVATTATTSGEDSEVYTKEGADNTFLKKSDIEDIYNGYGIDISKIPVSPDEFLTYTGIDLRMRLIGIRNINANASNAPEMFIKRIQLRLNNYIDTHFRGGVSNKYERPNPYQILHYKLAVIEQVLYVFNNTAITEDMGLDDNGYSRLTRNQIKEREISIECQRDLELAGLYNRNLYSGCNFYNCWWRF